MKKSALSTFLVSLGLLFAQAAPAPVHCDFYSFFEARNAIALHTLYPYGAAGDPALATEVAGKTYRRACPACGGSGERVLKKPDEAQRDGRIGGNGRKRIQCGLCGGRRTLVSYLPEAATSAAAASDYARFSAEHLSHGDVKAGYAFVPRMQAEVADKKDLKRVEEAFGKPCSRCRWTGLEYCKKCNGEGVLPCKNDDCRGGWDVDRIKHHGHRGHVREEVRAEICHECKGAALRLCSHCEGMCAKPCKSCGGSGLKQHH